MEDTTTLKAVIEAIIFLSGEPVTAGEIKALTALPEQDVDDIAGELISDYASRDGGILLGRISGGYQMFTNPKYRSTIMQLKGSAKPNKLSMPALETLAIVAYRQPITKAEVEEVRGVNSDGIMKSLLDKRLIKILGKKEAPGRPMLYGTTREFLQHFGLNELSELPTLKDLEREDAA